RHLAYIPEGPTLPWDEVAHDPARWLDPLIAHVRGQRAFTLRIGPHLVRRQWDTQTAKDALAAGDYGDFSRVPADHTNPTATELVGHLQRQGWERVGGGDGRQAGQPNLVVQIPMADRSLPQLQSSLNQLWRRNIAKAAKSGVQVRLCDSRDLPAFHELFIETATREEFIPRELSYFQGMWRAFDGDKPDSALKLYFAELDGRPLAAATVITVGSHSWYGYGASTSQHRDARAANALQWHILRDAHARGCTVYDLRGVGHSPTDGGPLPGLLRFKLGMGGITTEYIGEWDLALSPMLHRAFQAYLKHRS
ncbi:MAG: lipid II:glycine glycyltransferase FemX, partial [Angustibacter sp.]